MCDCLPKMLCVYCIYIYIYHVNKFEARLLFLYLPLKNVMVTVPLPPPHPCTHTKQNISHLDVIWHEFVKYYIIYSLKQIVLFVASIIYC